MKRSMVLWLLTAIYLAGIKDSGVTPSTVLGAVLEMVHNNRNAIPTTHRSLKSHTRLDEIQKNAYEKNI